MMKIRSRWWHAPTLAADTIFQTASYPRSAKSPSTAPQARRTVLPDPSPRVVSADSMSRCAVALKSPLTFSITTACGRSVAMASAMCTHSPERVPCWSPALRPAAETSWHGKPPTRMSMGSTVAQLRVVMSPRLGVPGNRAASTLQAAGSISECQMMSPPNTCCTAFSRCPDPEKRPPIRGPATWSPLCVFGFWFSCPRGVWKHCHYQILRI